MREVYSRGRAWGRHQAGWQWCPRFFRSLGNLEIWVASATTECRDEFQCRDLNGFESKYWNSSRHWKSWQCGDAGTPAYTSQNMISGLDLMVPTNKSDGSMLRLQGKSLWGSMARSSASARTAMLRCIEKKSLFLTHFRGNVSWCNGEARLADFDDFEGLDKIEEVRLVIKFCRWPNFVVLQWQKALWHQPLPSSWAEEFHQRLPRETQKSQGAKPSRSFSFAGGRRPNFVAAFARIKSFIY